MREGFDPAVLEAGHDLGLVVLKNTHVGGRRARIEARGDDLEKPAAGAQRGLSLGVDDIDAGVGIGAEDEIAVFPGSTGLRRGRGFP